MTRPRRARVALAAIAAIVIAGAVLLANAVDAPIGAGPDGSAWQSPAARAAATTAPGDAPWGRDVIHARATPHPPPIPPGLPTSFLIPDGQRAWQPPEIPTTPPAPPADRTDAWPESIRAAALAAVGPR